MVLSESMKDQIFKLIKEDIPTGFNYYKSPLKTTKGKIEKLVEERRPTSYLIENVDDNAHC